VGELGFFFGVGFDDLVLAIFVDLFDFERVADADDYDVFWEDFF
jgi:hypothetical protein